MARDAQNFRDRAQGVESAKLGRIRRSVSASVLDLVESAWLDGDAGPARARLAAHCISALGNCHRACPVALSPHTGRAVVRSPVTAQTPYTQGFLVHYLDKLIYPQLTEAVVTWSGAIICAAILGVHYIPLSRTKLTQPEKT